MGKARMPFSPRQPDSANTISTTITAATANTREATCMGASGGSRARQFAARNAFWLFDGDKTILDVSPNYFSADTSTAVQVHGPLSVRKKRGLAPRRLGASPRFFRTLIGDICSVVFFMSPFIGRRPEHITPLRYA